MSTIVSKNAARAEFEGGVKQQDSHFMQHSHVILHNRPKDLWVIVKNGSQNPMMRLRNHKHCVINYYLLHC